MGNETAMTDETLLQEMVARLVAAGHPRRVVLFGSRARGDEQADSDYDFLVVEPSDEPAHKRSVRYYDALRRYTQPLDVVVYTPDEVEDYAELPQSFVMTALREGRVLYEVTH